MYYFSAIKYYFNSLITLFKYTEYWKIPLLLVKKPILFTVNIKDKKHTFYVDRLMDIWVLKELMLDKQYNYYGKAEKIWDVVDVGVGIGEFAIMLSQRVNHVYAFDPDNNRFLLSEKNIKLHNVKNITLVKEPVKVIDDVFSEYKLKKCDLLKIDCEGCEYSVLLNSNPNVLKKIDRIIMEAHLFTPTMRTKYRKLKKLLIDNGFKIIENRNPVHNYLKFVYAYR